jgi:glucans biosynthesis protein
MVIQRVIWFSPMDASSFFFACLQKGGACLASKRVVRYALFIVLSLTCLVLEVFPPCAEAQQGFSLQNVIDEARKLAKQPYRIEGRIPDFLLKIGYDDWREIRFEPSKALWANDKIPFTVQFFHPGFYYNRTVAIYTVDSKGVRPVPFSPDLFDYGKNDFKDKVPENLGFAGFRIHYPINTPEYQDEVAVFLGASYFRAVAKNMGYGLSARGLAIDTGLSTGEEFPFFRKFWIVKPSRGAKKITVYALLDSPSLTGAYRYVIAPGKETAMDVTSRLFLRKSVQKLGIAPLTSMFFCGENDRQHCTDDYRPEVHDSDGLMIAASTGEWIWRPLTNPRTLQINSFQCPNPVGFGLIQRDTDFDHYQDLEARYEDRPSVWIRPVGKWGDGRVELILIPSDKEIHDNITAFWVPSRLPEGGKPIWYSYKMSWYRADASRPPAGRVTSTRIAKGKDDRTKKFILDFAGGKLEALPADKPLTAVVSADPRAKLVEQQLYKNSVTKGWRLVFQITFEEPGSLDKVLPQSKRAPAELRAFLKLGDSALTETWTYTYQP